MRRNTKVATVLAVALAATMSLAGTAAGAITPTTDLKLTSVTCNPGGTPGLRATVSATSTPAAIRSAQLTVQEMRSIPAGSYYPFDVTGWAVATWWQQGGSKTAATTDGRTVDSTDEATWDRHSYQQGTWTASASTAWWEVAYSLTLNPRGTYANAWWYVSCPTGTIIPGSTYPEPTWITVDGTHP